MTSQHLVSWTRGLYQIPNTKSLTSVFMVALIRAVCFGSSKLMRAKGYVVVKDAELELFLQLFYFLAEISNLLLKESHVLPLHLQCWLGTVSGVVALL